MLSQGFGNATVDYLVWLGGVAIAIAAIYWVVERLFVRPFRSWLRGEVSKISTSSERAAASAAQAAQQLHSSNGSTVANIVEGIESKLSQVDSKVDELEATGARNRTDIETLRQMAGRGLDRVHALEAKGHESDVEIRMLKERLTRQNQRIDQLIMTRAGLPLRQEES